MAKVASIVSDSSIELAKIDVAKQQGRCTPAMMQLEQELLKTQDVMSDMTVAEAEFAIGRKNWGMAVRHLVITVMFFGAMVASVHGAHQQNEKDNNGKAKTLMTVAMALTCLSAHHGKRSYDYFSDYSAACQDYLKRYEEINKRLDEINIKTVEKVK